jgi:hypothetical protein
LAGTQASQTRYDEQRCPTGSTLAGTEGVTLDRATTRQQPPPSEKILVLGPAGSGKTYTVGRLRALGINAFDADAVPGLLRFLDRAGRDVPFPVVVDADWFAAHDVVWDLDVLQRLLAAHDPVYLFGLSGNAFAVRHIFDRAYCLKADPSLIEQRLQDPSRLNPVGKTAEQRQLTIRNLAGLYRRAAELGFEMLDAALSPEEIFAKICQSHRVVRG